MDGLPLDVLREAVRLLPLPYALALVVVVALLVVVGRRLRGVKLPTPEPAPVVDEGGAVLVSPPVSVEDATDRRNPGGGPTGGMG